MLLLPSQEAAAASCGGKRATIVGTAGNDVLVGKKASDLIDGGGGNDRISGGPNGNDTICGGPGDDRSRRARLRRPLRRRRQRPLAGETGADRSTAGGATTAERRRGQRQPGRRRGDDELLGAKGPDRLFGGDGNDFLIGDKGSDETDGGGGDDRLAGDKGNDRSTAIAGEDQVDGGAGDDPQLDGGSGSDSVFAGTGIDSANGGEGDGDIVRGDSGIDTLDGGPGSQDIVSYASATRSGVIVNLGAGKSRGDGHDTLQGFEDVVGSPQGDDIAGDGGANRLDGGVGDDDLVGGCGSDEAFGGAGSDDCEAFSVEHSCGAEENPPGNGTFVILNQGLDGSSLIVQGTVPPTTSASRSTGRWTVSDGGGVFAGDGCSQSSDAAAICSTAVPTSLLVDHRRWRQRQHRRRWRRPGRCQAAGQRQCRLGLAQRRPRRRRAGGRRNYNGPDSGNDLLSGNGGSDVLYADPGRRPAERRPRQRPSRLLGGDLRGPYL